MPTLYVVATPIGNLNDLTPRMREALEAADLIAAEDTRVTMKLLNQFDLHRPMVSCHRHNEEAKAPRIVEKMLAEDLTVALTCDAGTPGISDPGHMMVDACWAAGIPVEPVCGPSAVVTCLSASGFDAREFAFYGFLPREKKALREKLQQMAAGVPIGIVHESPHRVTALVEAAAETIPGVRLSLSCDLTKLHEKTIRGTAEEVLAQLAANPNAEKGEYCLILDFHHVEKAGQEEQLQPASLEAQLTDWMLTGLTLREAQEKLTALGAKKNAVKAAALRLKKTMEEQL